MVYEFRTTIQVIMSSIERKIEIEQFSADTIDTNREENERQLNSILEIKWIDNKKIGQSVSKTGIQNDGQSVVC